MQAAGMHTVMLVRLPWPGHAAGQDLAQGSSSSSAHPPHGAWPLLASLKVRPLMLEALG